MPYYRTKKITHWHVMGTYLGYPSCCIEEFVSSIELCICTGLQKVLDRNQSKVHKNKGFIPCPNCAEKLVQAGKGVETLIRNRICATPFPKMDVT